MLILMVTSPVSQEGSIHAEQLRNHLFRMRSNPFGNQQRTQGFPPTGLVAGQVGWVICSYGKSDREYSELVERMGMWVDADPTPRRLRPTRWNTQTPFSIHFRPPRKRPLSMVSERSLSVSYPRDVRGVTSEKHMTWSLIRVLLDVSDELHDGTSHEVWFIDSISVTDGGHVFFKCLGHTQACLVRVFLHISNSP